MTPRDPNSDAAFDAWVGDARTVTVLEEVQRRNIALRRAGTELVGPCPVCGGTDRFSVNPRRNVFCCRKGGAGGDAIALVQYLDGADFLGACETLTGTAPPRGEGTRATPQALATRAEARRAKEAEREASSARYREKERKALYGIWRAAARHDLAPVRAYLALRGLDLPPGAPLRFLPDAPFFHGREDDGRGNTHARMIWRGPAMIAAITGPEGVFAGLHCTWLDLSAPKGKAQITDPETCELLPAKKVRGSKQGGRILLVRAPCGTARLQKAGEGIETVLAVWAAMTRGGADLSETEFVSGVDLGNLTGRALESLPHPTLRKTDAAGRSRAVRVAGPVADMNSAALWVPETVSHLTLLADGDSDPFATRCAMERGQQRHRAPGRVVTVAWPPEGFDFNDVLQGRHLRKEAA